MKKKQVKKIFIILVLLVLFISVSVIIYAANTIINPTTIYFQDTNLYDSIKKQLSAKKIAYNYEDVSCSIEISLNDIDKISELDLSTSSINNLSGLENFANLSTLNLSKNMITVASPLMQLNRLESLDMTENTVNTEILTTLSNLTTLQELNMTNTKMNGDQLEYFKNLTNLKTLKLSSNNISAIGKISNLTNLNVLDISVNTSFTDFLQLTSFVNLIELNVSGTGITTFSGSEEGKGIEKLEKLEKLYASDIKGIITSDGIKSIYSVNYNDDINEAYLKNLKFLNLSSMGTNGNRPYVDLYNFANLTSLEELHLASNEINTIYGISDLVNLKVLDLRDNEIYNIDDIVSDEEEKGLKAEKIDFSRNKIVDISVFKDYSGELKWLDLSENQIYDIEPLNKYQFNNNNGKTLYLENQDITFGLHSKNIDVNHYILLPTIFTYNKKNGTFAFSQDVTFECSDGIELNPDYVEADEYNVIIDYNKFNEENLSIKIKGGVADGTKLCFKIGDTGNNNCYIESIFFKDEILYSKIKEIIEETIDDNYLNYFKSIPMIINVDSNVISLINELNLQHIDEGNDTKIKDLTGLENFSYLQNLYLQNNNVNTIEQLKSCTNLKILNLASNSRIKDNNGAIENLSNLVTLNLSGTGMSNINCINKLSELGYNNILILDISDNSGLKNIDGLENLTNLQSLSLANDNLSQDKISKIKELVNLTTLNINSNQVENLDIISNLEQLKYLYFNNNNVKDLEKLKNKVFYELEFMGNKIKDISPLSAHRTINNLKMDNNQIEDVTVLSRISMSNEQNLSVTGQKIVKMLEQDITGEMSIQLPQIFKASQESGNKIYSNAELLLTNCTLDGDSQNIIIDTNNLNDDVAQVEIISGKAKGTKLIISAPLSATITYTPSNTKKTNQNITATIQFNNDDREITITNNDKKNTYVFEQNGEFIFRFIDKYGIEGYAVAVVQNIDKEQPVGKVSQVFRNGIVEVTITVNEKVEDIKGWKSTVLEDGTMILKKEYSADANEEIELIDEAGNISTINVDVIVKKNDTITSSNFKVSEDELTIKGISPKTTVSDFIKNINAEINYKILDKKGNEVSQNDKMGTGCTIKMENGKTYIIIVWGDLDGDGKISLTELALISKIGVNKVTPSDIEKSAIDMNMNGKIELSELAAIAKLQVK